MSSSSDHARAAAKHISTRALLDSLSDEALSSTAISASHPAVQRQVQAQAPLGPETKPGPSEATTSQLAPRLKASPVTTAPGATGHSALNTNTTAARQPTSTISQPSDAAPSDRHMVQPAAAMVRDSAAPAAAPAGSSTLAPAVTGKGPLVFHSVDDSAQAQQVLQVLDNYEFRMYGQGLMAGSDAVPLTPPEHKVMFAPTPERPEAQTQQQQHHYQQQHQHQPEIQPSSPTLTAAAATAAAEPVRAQITTTESGTPALGMQPLPTSTSSTSTSTSSGGSAIANGLQKVVDVASSWLPGAGAAADTAAASPAGPLVQQSPVSPVGLVSSVPPAQQLKSQLQQQLISTSAGPLPRHRKQQHQPQQQQQQLQPTQLSTQRAGRFVVTTCSTSSTSSSSSRRRGGGKGGSLYSRVTGAVTGFVERMEQKLLDFGQNVLEEVVYYVWVVLSWIGWLLLWPFKTVFLPWYNYNRQLKEASSAHLAAPYDIAKLQELLGALPSWLSGIGGATEQLDWLNSLLAQVWPVLDPVVCELVRTTIEPLLEDMKPPFIAKMGFQKLTLGELPVVLDGIRLVGSGDKSDVSGNESLADAAAAAAAAQAAATQDDRLEVEVDFHWVGEPNISFFVEMALAGPYTRLVPKVSHLTSQGTLRLGLTRLVPQLPGFGAILISCARTPQVKFTLDFGPALGGKVTAKPVANFLDPFLRDTLASLLVWPNRFVVPLLPRSVTGNLDSLSLHSVGVLEVEVLSAHNLPKKGGLLSTVDPQVEIWTQPQHRVHSSVKKGRRNPKWKGQLLEVLVQEPDSQLLRVQMQDIDMLNVTELLRLNVVKGATKVLKSANPIGHAALPLRDICSQPFKRQEVELRLAGSEWAYELGVVGQDDAGSLSLALTYRPFMDQAADSAEPIACRGALFVTVRQCQELPAGDWDSATSDPYVLLKVAGQKQQTVVMPHSVSPTFNAHFEFFNVQVPDVLTVQVYDRDFLKPDDHLGEVVLPVKDILTWTQGGVRGMRDGWWRLRPKGAKSWEKAGRGRIEMKVQYRPYSS